MVGKACHGEKNIHRYYQHTVGGTRNGCQIQRVVAHEVEDSVIQYIWSATENAGYLNNIEEKIRKSRNTKSLDVVRNKAFHGASFSRCRNLLVASLTEHR